MSAHEALDNDHSGLLSEATLSALQLSHQPFTTDLGDIPKSDEQSDDVLGFFDAETESQLADIKQALITGDDLLLVLGENGSGKSTVLEQLDANSGLRIQCFSVTGNDRFSTHNLFAGMLEAFQVPPPEKLKDILDELVPCLQTMVERNTLSAIVLDDAHKANPAELTRLLSAMLYVNRQDETLMRVALAANPEFESAIPSLLPEGADLPYSSLTLEGLSPSRAAAYLDYRLQLAGFDQEFPFTERDMASLVDHSGGRPAELHALTADVLNEKHGRLDERIPHELMAEEAGFLGTRGGKLILGALATALIVGGLLMFLPSGDPRPGDNSTQDIVTRTPQPVVVSPPEPVIVVADAPASDTINTLTSTQAADQDAQASDAQASSMATDLTSSDDNIDSANGAADLLQSAEEQATQLESDERILDTVETATNAVDAVTDNVSAEVSADLSADVPADIVSDSSENVSSQATVTDTSADSPDPADAEPINRSDSNGDADANATRAPSTTVPLDGGENSSIAGLLESPSWILVQDETQYTVQLSASRDLESVQNFLRRNPIDGPNSIFSFEREGSVWYALVHGIFPTLTEARQAVEQLPEGAQRDQPWIRSISRVKEIMRQP